MFGDLGPLVGGLGSPDSPDVQQLIHAIDLVQAAADADAGPLAGLDVETERVGAVGHSAGGFAVYGAAAADPRIVTYVALASPVGGSFTASASTTVPLVPPPDKPSLLIAGSADAIAPLARIQAAYDALPSPKAFAVIDGVTHLGFMDICALTAPGEPTVLQVAKDAGVAIPDLILRLFADGCDPKYVRGEHGVAGDQLAHDSGAPRCARPRRSTGRAHAGGPRCGVPRPDDLSLGVAVTDLPARGRSRDDVLADLDTMRARRCRLAIRTSLHPRLPRG